MAHSIAPWDTARLVFGNMRGSHNAPLPCDGPERLVAESFSFETKPLHFNYGWPSKDFSNDILHLASHNIASKQYQYQYLVAGSANPRVSCHSFGPVYFLFNNVQCDGAFGRISNRMRW